MPTAPIGGTPSSPRRGRASSSVQDVDERPGLGAFVGEVHANILRALGCVAYVTNGTVRDLRAVHDVGLQAFASGTTPSHAFAHIVGFGAPVEIAGLAVAPGDLLFGDRHGLVSVPPAAAADVRSIAADMNAQRAAGHRLLPRAGLLG